MTESEFTERFGRAVAEALEEEAPTSPLFAVALRYSAGSGGPADLDVVWADERFRDEELERAARTGRRPELLTAIEYPGDLMDLDDRLGPEVAQANADLRAAREAGTTSDGIEQSTVRAARWLQEHPPRVALSDDFVVFADDTNEVGTRELFARTVPPERYQHFKEQAWLPDGF